MVLTKKMLINQMVKELKNNSDNNEFLKNLYPAMQQSIINKAYKQFNKINN